MKLPEREKQAYRRYREDLASEPDVIVSAHQIGWLEGVQETARNLFNEGFSAELVAKVTGLPIAAVIKLSQQ